MIHEMKLKEKEFNNIKYNGKVIEVRLNDEKRKRINQGDEIIFYKVPLLKETILVEVKEIFKCSTFQQVYMKFSSDDFGYKDLNISEMLKNIYNIYDKKQEKEYGVIAIKFTIKKNMV